MWKVPEFRHCVLLGVLSGRTIAAPLLLVPGLQNAFPFPCTSACCFQAQSQRLTPEGALLSPLTITKLLRSGILIGGYLIFTQDLPMFHLHTFSNLSSIYPPISLHLPHTLVFSLSFSFSLCLPPCSSLSFLFFLFLMCTHICTLALCFFLTSMVCLYKALLSWYIQLIQSLP